MTLIWQKKIKAVESAVAAFSISNEARSSEQCYLFNGADSGIASTGTYVMSCVQRSTCSSLLPWQRSSSGKLATGKRRPGLYKTRDSRNLCTETGG